jgi:N,N-dimethylformamidase beta subunit-like, C-terminal/FlgD Ig-like domain
VTRAATGVFCALVVATFAAFFVAQRLKNEPSVVKGFRRLATISPNGDGRKDATPISFFLKKSDNVSVDIVDDNRTLVRSLVDDRHLAARERIRGVRWDGRDDEGRVVPDGFYFVRVTLRREGRAVFPAAPIAVDDTPPRPRVVSIGPTTGIVAPEYLPNNRDGGVQIKVVAAGVDRRLLIFRTDVRPFQLVRTLTLGTGSNERDWDGTDDQGRQVPDGTYVVVAQARDHAGNTGSIPPLDGTGRPAFSYGTHFGGRGGVTVRHIAVQPPFIPPKAGTLMHALVDARGRPYTWSIRRLGEPGVIRGSGRKTKYALNIHAPRGSSGLYLLSAHRAGHTTTVPVPVQGRGHQPVLVVLPYMTWQGRNPVDDDGDGMPNMLDLGIGVRGARPFAGKGLPANFLHAEAPTISWLDHTHRKYDITTDLALALGQGPKLEGHKGVLIPGDARWLTKRLGAQPRAFVRDGGTVASLGTGSLERRVRLSPKGRLYAPTPASRTDLFGAQLRPLQRGKVTLQSLTDHLQLFAGTNGTLGPFGSYEETRRVGPEADLASDAVIAAGGTIGRPVIVAADYGKGKVIRTGLPELPDRLSAGGNAGALMERIWTLLSR